MAEDKTGLPVKVFLYTLDQIAAMLEVKVETLKLQMLHYDGRSPGISPKGKLRAHNIMPEGETPEWRITEREFIRFLKHKGIRVYQRGYGI